MIIILFDQKYVSGTYGFKYKKLPNVCMLKYYRKHEFFEIFWAANSPFSIWPIVSEWLNRLTTIDILIQLTRWSRGSASDWGERGPWFDSRFRQWFLDFIFCFVVAFIFCPFAMWTRQVLSETKAIMSPPYVTGWNQFFCRGRWNHKLELSQKVMNTPCATWESWLIFNLDLEPTLVKHRHCTLSHHS